MWDPKSNTDAVIGKGIKSVGWHHKLLFLTEEGELEACASQASNKQRN
jgi:hypothetical protein